MTQYSPAWPHGDLKEVFPNIFFVMGTNLTTHEGTKLQHSCNMVVVKNANELTLINTVRLNDEGLAALEKLGHIANVVRIGVFHGRHDAFYLDRYSAKLWALKGVKHENNKFTNNELITNGKMPFPDCSLFVFKTSIHPEAILHINREGGILITCDSIKNWITVDKFFSEETGKLYEKLGFLGMATISKIWQQACNIQAQDFAGLKLLTFKHLLSAHGEPLFNNAYEKLAVTIQQEFGI
ncbi:hypothetical protein CC99x_002630 [Candidatus Berkiella cookevillensis]|uniref:Uncharacterized protein n=1 Tax=Candidatus Berkiella cookevillensis TaxID=437022 RepID=A0A0Q9YDP5_9GAMM|nr:hypothetical protein [Candidatus Berkiella cookevillensis]MCS5707793.1 hypothetical protein [Candidatus Berkiella cookevillensis]